jgi:hypothetical protein
MPPERAPKKTYVINSRKDVTQKDRKDGMGKNSQPLQKTMMTKARN